ncbi:MAG: hypothetical protein AB7H85_18115 [Dehalococcoidia bacterium]
MSDSSWSKPSDEGEPTGSAPDATEEAPDPSTPPVGSPAPGGSNRWLLISLLSVMVLVLGGVLAGLAIYLTRGDGGGGDYAVDLGDDDYDLVAMALRNTDVPDGLGLTVRADFTNEEWALIFDETDIERYKSQFDAQKRVRNLVSVFAWMPGKPAKPGLALNVLSQSTLYETEEAAADAVAGSALCGLNVDSRAPVTDFKVPRIADQSAGFHIDSDTIVIDVDDITQEETNAKIIETVVCFRTGRVVHGVVQRAWDGSQDEELVIGLAKEMLIHADNAFEGKNDPVDPDPGG